MKTLHRTFRCKPGLSSPLVFEADTFNAFDRVSKDTRLIRNFLFRSGVSVGDLYVSMRQTAEFWFDLSTTFL